MSDETLPEASAQAKARDAIYEGIAAQAASRDVDELAKLADAYSKVAYGPSGGNYDYDADTRTQTDGHNTEHPSGEPRRSAGFENG